MGDVLFKVIEPDYAAVGLLQKADAAQQRCFTGTTAAQDRDDLALVDIEVHAFQHLGGAVAAMQVFYFQHGDVLLCFGSRQMIRRDIQNIVEVVVGDHHHAHGGDDHDLLLVEVSLEPGKELLGHVLGVVGNGAAVVDECLLLGGELKGIKINAVLFQQVAEVDAAHQAAVGLGDGILVKIGGAFADQAGQLIIQRVGACFDGVECGGIMQQRALFGRDGVPLGHVVSHDLFDVLGGGFDVDLTDSGHSRQAPFPIVWGCFAAWAASRRAVFPARFAAGSKRY